MAKKNRRPQAQKDYAHVLELRKGSRAQPVPSGKVYKRKAKHGGWD
jgi:hypothetical protein